MSMTSLATTQASTFTPLAQPISVATVGLALVWVTMASSGFVAYEPAPVDILSIGLIFLLPLLGLTQMRLPLLIAGLGWIVVAAGGFVAANLASDVKSATTHTAVTLYLSLFSITLAAFVLKDPERHGRLVISGYTVAALIAATLAIIGYFDLVPGSKELLTKYSRAKSTFKDPNVFGPFMILPIINLVTLFPRQIGWRKIATAFGGGILCFALLLSFSRAAGAALVLALLLCGYFYFIKANTARDRFRLAGFAITGIVGCALLIVTALQFTVISEIAYERAAITQSYDVGPDGRFGGQVKGLTLLLENPLGIGAGEFVPRYHHEEPHNVYIAMMMNAGWLGGLMYLALVGCVATLGVRRLIRTDLSERLFIVTTMSFLAHVAIGFLIDSDHWRHFFVLFGLSLGLSLGRSTSSDRSSPGASRDGLPYLAQTPATGPYQRRAALRSLSRS